MKNRVIEKLLRLVREQLGAELVEFSLCALMLMSLIVGVLGFGLAIYTYHFVSYAANQGLRFATVRGYTWSKSETTNCSTSAPPNFTMVYDCTASAADIQNYVQSLATGGISASGLTVNSAIWPGTNATGTTSGCTTNANSQECLVKVKVSYTFKFFTSEKLPSWTMSSTAEGTILQ